MNSSIDEIKRDLLSLTRLARARLEYEESFGVETFKNAPIKEKAMAGPKEAVKFANDKAGRLAALKNKVLECRECGLSASRNNVVFGEGNPEAELMFIGEAPGYYEDAKGEPFVGPAGELLTKIIKAIDLERKEVYIANILKCRPPENRDPNQNEISLCSHFLEKQINIVKPKVICALGAFAIKTLLKSESSISELRGKFYDYKGIKLIATFHPAYLLRNTHEKNKAWSDMKKVRAFLKETSPS